MLFMNEEYLINIILLNLKKLLHSFQKEKEFSVNI